ncbi:MAG: trigger factor [bacterium]
MPHEIKKENNQAIIKITIPAAEVEEGMRKAAESMSEDSSIPGFRPGKAPYDVVKQRVGEMKLLEAAAEELIRSAFVAAMLEADLETVGQPFFKSEKLAPGNDIIVTAEIALYPHVTELADYNSLTVEKKDTAPTPEIIEQAKKDLATMRTKEVRKAKGEKLQNGDKAVVSLLMKKDGVVIEGGEGQNHGIYTAEDYFIEGFIDKILGMAEDEERTFTLKFPKEHYQKHLAGQDVEFTVKINEIFSLEAPELNDEFAKSLGLKDAADLEEKLKENLRLESETEERLRQDKEVLDKVAEKSQFEEVPDMLVNQEIEKMLHELQHNVSERGMDFDKYMKDIGKTLADIKIDFAKPALTRVKIAIVLKEIAKRERIKVDTNEVDAEIDRIAKMYEGNEDAQKQIFDPAYRDYVTSQLTNRNVIDFLKKKMVK